MITVALVQTDIVWENISENLKIYQDKINKIESDVIILPEMFTTGFTMSPENLAEDMNGLTVNWMKENSEKLNSAICGSIIIKENNNFYNRFIWVNPDGTIYNYDKKHLFSFSGEDKSYTPGNTKLMVEYKGWKICPLICYDLRFPAWSRNLEDYDILIYVANWPTVRKHAWKNLLVSRAIENQCYVIGVNRVGFDNNGNFYSGETSLINALGETVYIRSHSEDIYTNTLTKLELNKVRKNLPFLSDRDNFQIIS